MADTLSRWCAWWHIKLHCRRRQFCYVPCSTIYRRPSGRCQRNQYLCLLCRLHQWRLRIKARDPIGHKAAQVDFDSECIGGAIGAFLLLHTPEALFTQSVPWLLLFAALLFTFGGQINSLIKKAASKHKHAGKAGAFFSALLLLLVCVYGGYFNAGLGIVTLSYLALAGYTNINVMNGIKLLVSASASMAAIILFIVDGSIDWSSGLAVLLGTLIGGYYSAQISRNIPQNYVRNSVIIASFLITAYFFYAN